MIDFSQMDITHKERGEMKMKQASIMTWKGGKVVEVKFVYDM